MPGATSQPQSQSAGDYIGAEIRAWEWGELSFNIYYFKSPPTVPGPVLCTPYPVLPLSVGLALLDFSCGRRGCVDRRVKRAVNVGRSGLRARRAVCVERIPEGTTPSVCGAAVAVA